MKDKELMTLREAMMRMLNTQVRILKAQARLLDELENNDILTLGDVEDIRELLRETYHTLKDLRKHLDENRE